MPPVDTSSTLVTCVWPAPHLLPGTTVHGSPTSPTVCMTKAKASALAAVLAARQAQWNALVAANDAEASAPTPKVPEAEIPRGVIRKFKVQVSEEPGAAADGAALDGDGDGWLFGCTAAEPTESDGWFPASHVRVESARS